LTSAESIKAKLKKLADKAGKDFNYLLMRYLIERLLYRLSVSSYADNFILKGGLLLYAVLKPKARATRDIDLLAQQIINAPEELVRIFTDIAALPSDDAVFFDARTITVERINEDADYQGIRIKLTGYLDRSRHVLQFDIGFGDIVVPRPVSMTYPSLLDMEPPRLKAYTLESVLAEKFQAIIYLAEANSRMKDFYDIYEICGSFDFGGSTLYRAISQTFEHRKTDMPQSPSVFTERFSKLPDKQAQWLAFQRRIGVTEEREFSEVITVIKGFLAPVYNALYSKADFVDQWDSKDRIWREGVPE
jgi:predicted nucleotidyltransferase component of viral defense system